MYLTLLFLLICLVLKVSDFIPRPSHGGVSGNYSGCHGVVKGPYTFCHPSWLQRRQATGI